MRRLWLWPLVPVYRLGLMAEGLLRRVRGVAGAAGVQRLRTPVISIGSLSAGGAGKTPVVMMLAEVLTTEGLRVAILTRGYGRRSDLVERVVAEAGSAAAVGTGDAVLFDEAAELGAAARFGDEPLMLARQGEAAVYVGADRFAAGTLAEREMGGGAPKVFVLDDGFQHRRLARSLDVVLLTAEDVRDHLLPAGNLREPLTALRRADVVVLREEEAGLARAVAEICRRRTMPAVWMIRRRLVVREANEAGESSVGAAMPRRALAFCGIARPESLTAMLAGVGCEPVRTVAFRDHHAYTEADILRLVEMAAANGADGFVTTEKDAVKLTAAMRTRLVAAGSLVVVGVEVELVDRGAVVADLARVMEEARIFG